MVVNSCYLRPIMAVVALVPTLKKRLHPISHVVSFPVSLACAHYVVTRSPSQTFENESASRAQCNEGRARGQKVANCRPLLFFCFLSLVIFFWSPKSSIPVAQKNPQSSTQIGATLSPNGWRRRKKRGGGIRQESFKLTA